ncbi:hypothetical protein EON79_22785 [bacterium]|nr:MAG: hypothetical protein EON79_22785 [bacterium]
MRLFWPLAGLLCAGLVFAAIPFERGGEPLGAGLGIVGGLVGGLSLYLVVRQLGPNSPKGFGPALTMAAMLGKLPIIGGLAYVASRAGKEGLGFYAGGLVLVYFITVGRAALGGLFESPSNESERPAERPAEPPASR